MMTYLSHLFNTIWSLFSIQWPGFPFTIGQAFIGILCAVFGLKVLTLLTGFSFDLRESFSGVFRNPGEQKGGNNKNIKVSKERKGDTK